MSTNHTNIVLVHGGWADGSGWSKEIPILRAAGHKVITVQLPLHSLSDDVATVKRVVEHVGGPTIFGGHSYGGAVINNCFRDKACPKGFEIRNEDETGKCFPITTLCSPGQHFDSRTKKCVPDVIVCPKGFLFSVY